MNLFRIRGCGMKIKNELMSPIYLMNNEKLNYRKRLIKVFRAMFFYGLIFGLFACSEDHEKPVDVMKIEARWYDAQQVALGRGVYAQNCISCHLESAKGTLDWRKSLEDGSYPPPPLNGTAHAWHHSIGVLLTAINDGGVPNGGTMPAFRNSLSHEQKLAVIAYIQSFWSEDIYSKWADVFKKH